MRAGADLAAIRERKPLVHQITNYVVMNETANATLALGALPVMAHAREEVEERLRTGTTRMRPQDWKSGDRLWVIEIIAPFGGADEMLKDLKAKVFPERQLKFLATAATGREVKVI